MADAAARCEGGQECCLGGVHWPGQGPPARGHVHQPCWGHLQGPGTAGAERRARACIMRPTRRSKCIAAPDPGPVATTYMCPSSVPPKLPICPIPCSQCPVPCCLVTPLSKSPVLEPWSQNLLCLSPGVSLLLDPNGCVPFVVARSSILLCSVSCMTWSNKVTTCSAAVPLSMLLRKPVGS